MAKAKKAKRALRKGAPRTKVPARKKAARKTASPKRTVKAVAPRYHTVTPFLNIRGAAAAIEFYKRAFGASERLRMPGPNGEVMHAELVIGDSTVMLSEAMQHPESRASLHLHVDDCDSLFSRAVSAGATVKMPLANMFWGDRYGQVSDPFGIVWSIATHVEDVPPKEMQRRMAALPPPSLPSRPPVASA